MYRSISNWNLGSISSKLTKRKREKKSEDNKRCVTDHFVDWTYAQVDQQQAETTAKRRAGRAEAFVAPTEDASPTVKEKRKRRPSAADLEAEMDGEEQPGKEKEKKRKKKHRVPESMESS